MAKKRAERKLCCDCGKGLAVVGEKYCKDCRRHVLHVLTLAGYLTDTKAVGAQICERLDRPQISSIIISGSPMPMSNRDDW
jgi:predicted amidophosphoribosyltransferase